MKVMVMVARTETTSFPNEKAIIWFRFLEHLYSKATGLKDHFSSYQATSYIHGLFSFCKTPWGLAVCHVAPSLIGTGLLSDSGVYLSYGSLVPMSTDGLSLQIAVFSSLRGCVICSNSFLFSKRVPHFGHFWSAPVWTVNYPFLILL
jgi:hypothetical protein